MTPCEGCHLHPAVVHFTRVEGGESTTVHLCGRCAAERGIDPGPTASETPLGAFLAAMGTAGAPLAAAASSGDACTRCGATLHDFRASGRVGCDACWERFAKPLRDLLRRFHGATRHTGGQYLGGDPSRRLLVDERDRLRRGLQEAVAGEHFERAAELRDRLRELEGLA